MKYVPLDRILAKLYRDIGLAEISEVDVIEWCGEALDLIGTVTMYQRIISIADIDNYSVELPIGLQYIDQVAINMGKKLDTKKIKNAIEQSEVSSNNKILTEQDVDGYVPTVRPQAEDTDTSDMGQTGSDISSDSWQFRNIYYPFTNLPYTSYTILRQQFVPLRLANHSLFGSLVMHEDSNMVFNMSEYSVVDNMLRFSFKDGQILISYYRQPLDEKTGYPLIPDITSVIQAVTSYVVYKWMQRNWYLGRQGFDAKMQKAEQDWHWYCRQAKGVLIMPKGVQGHQDLMEQQNEKLPRMNRFYGFFGNLSNRR